MFLTAISVRFSWSRITVGLRIDRENDQRSQLGNHVQPETANSGEPERQVNEPVNDDAPERPSTDAP
jgi:hypothetical protein